jgi:hypothetical protein
MSPELEAQYAEASRPFVDGAITEEAIRLKPWRVFLEINSVCNLRCPTCTKGNQPAVNGLKYDHQTGIMDESLMERILDKITSENPKASSFFMVIPGLASSRLPECITALSAGPFSAIIQQPQFCAAGSRRRRGWS